MMFFDIDFFAFWSQIGSVWGIKMGAEFALRAPPELHGNHRGHPFGSLGYVLAYFGAICEESGAPRPRPWVFRTLKIQLRGSGIE